MEDESQVIVECYAKVGTTEIRFCHLLLVRPEMGFQFQLEAKASVSGAFWKIRIWRYANQPLMENPTGGSCQQIARGSYTFL